MHLKHNDKILIIPLLCGFLFSFLVIFTFPRTTTALDKAVEPTDVPKAWDFPINDDNFNHTLGTGVKVAIIDSGIDWQHPDFFRPNFSQTYNVSEHNGEPYIDFNHNDSYDEGEGGMINHTSVFKNSTNYATSAIDPGIDYGFNDSNQNGQYDFGETICYYNDEDGNGQVNGGDTAVALGESKIDIIRDYAEGRTYVNGVNLTEPDINTEVDKDGHGTHVAGIVAGGWPKLRNITGVAPNCSLMMYKYYADLTQCIRDAVDDGADLISISLGQYFRNLTLDGTVGSEGGSNFDYWVDWAYDQGVPVVCSAGNEAEKNAHTYNEIPAGGNEPGSFSIPFDLLSSPTELDFTNLWLSPHNKIGVNITIPNPEEGDPITIPDEYYNSSLPWDGQPHEYQPSGLSNPLIIQRSRSPMNINGVNKSFVNITYDKGSLASGEGEYTVLNFGDDTQKVHTYIHTIISNGWYSGLPASEWTEHINKNFTLTPPATANHSITVGSFISDGSNLGEISSFSSRGPRIDGKKQLDLTAPGQLLLSAASKNASSNFGIGNYTDKMGTSMAAPFISGVVALTLESNDNLKGKPHLIKDLLINSTFEDEHTRMFGEGYNNVTGYGKINASLMLLNAQGPSIGEPSLTSNGYPYPVNISTSVRAPKGISEVWLYYTNDSWANTYSIKLSNVQSDEYFGQLLHQDYDVEIQYYIRATDLFGINGTNENGTYYYTDLIAPKVYIENPEDGSIQTGESVDINATISDEETSVAEAKTLINASDPFNLSMSYIDGSWHCQWANLTLYPAADYNISIIAKDQTGNSNHTQWVVMKLVKDETPPNIFFEAPSNQTSVSDPFNITVSVNDTEGNYPDANDVYATIYNDTADISFNLTMMQVADTENWTVQWNNITKYTAGIYYINVTAFDSSHFRNRNETGTLQITYIDAYAPSVRISSPSYESEYEPPNVVDINATVSDNESSVSSVKAMINASIPFNLSMDISSGQKWVCNWDNISEEVYSPGDYNITIWALDTWGNINCTESTMITINKDLEEPLISIHSPLNDSDHIGPFNITATIQDPHAPSPGDVYATIWNETIEFNLTLHRIDDTTNWTGQWENITDHAPGGYYINVTAIDSSYYQNQNETGMLNITYSLDTIPPVISFHTPATNNTEVTSESIEFKVFIEEDNIPSEGDVNLTIANVSLLFTTIMSYEGNDTWSFAWVNVSLYANGNYSIQVCAEDSSPNGNINFAHLYVFLNISTQAEDESPPSETKNPYVRFWEAFTSPEILTLVGVLGVLILFELFLARKSQYYRSSEEERKRILKIMEEE
ncbi:MAG: S8 family serine peptidase [Promethearchaeia archaeon]